MLNTPTISYTQYDHEKHYHAVKGIFLEAFPEYLPREVDRCVDLVNRGRMKCMVMLASGNPAGFIFYKEYKDFFYCEYIAVAEAYRGKHYGNKLLAWTKRLGSEQWIFEIEITEKCGEECPNIKLFRGEGFFENKFGYSMPRIDEVNPGATYRLWSRYPLSEKEFDKAVETLSNDPDF